jgi:hypothetical protein
VRRSFQQRGTTASSSFPGIIASINGSGRHTHHDRPRREIAGDDGTGTNGSALTDS